MPDTIRLDAQSVLLVCAIEPLRGNQLRIRIAIDRSQSSKAVPFVHRQLQASKNGADDASLWDSRKNRAPRNSLDDSRFSWGCRTGRSQSPSGSSYPPADRSGLAWSGSECRRADSPICRPQRAACLWSRPAFWSSLSGDRPPIPRRCTECPRPHNPEQRRQRPKTRADDDTRDRMRGEISGLAGVNCTSHPAAFLWYRSSPFSNLSRAIILSFLNDALEQRSTFLNFPPRAKNFFSKLCLRIYFIWSTICRMSLAFLLRSRSAIILTVGCNWEGKIWAACTRTFRILM